MSNASYGKTEPENSSIAASENSNHELLKARLVKYWNDQENERDVGLDKVAAGLPIRGRVASFLPIGARILDVACGTAANAEWFKPKGPYFGTDITLWVSPAGEDAGETSDLCRRREASIP